MSKLQTKLSMVMAASLFILSLSVLADEWAVTYIGESFHNVQGGSERGGGYLGNLDVTAQWDELNIFTPKAKIFLYLLADHGDNPSDRIGDAQGYSNIAAPRTGKIYELWFEQPFNAERSSWKFGLIDLNSEFYVTETSGIFQNSSFGIGPDFSQSGKNGPSIFPSTSVGVRLATLFQENGYGQCIALDGVPGDPNNEKGTHIQFNHGDGALLGCEAGWHANTESDGKHVAKIGLGVWRYTSDSDKLNSSGTEKNHGVYVIGEHTLWQSGEHSLAGFAQLGFADEAVNQFSRYQGAGLVWNGVWLKDASDQLGIAVASVENGDDYIAAETANGNIVGRRETTTELVYRFALNEWLTLQPSVQYIHNPGMDPTLDDAVAASLRFELSTGGKW